MSNLINFIQFMSSSFKYNEVNMLDMLNMAIDDRKVLKLQVAVFASLAYRIIS